MKRINQLAIGTLLLIGIGGASAQSLGDYARTVRKNKVEPQSASRHFDNENLPTDQKLSVVGPPADANTNNRQATSQAVTNPAAVAADRQKTDDDLKKKLDKQKEKVDSLNHELDLDQREYRLRAAAMYGDAGSRLRNAAEWDKEDTKYKSDVEGKKKSLDAAQQELDQLQEDARKAGIADKDKQ